MTRFCVFLTILLMQPLPALAQMESDAQCSGTPQPLPAELAGWTKAMPHMAATQAVNLGKAHIPLGEGVVATLGRTADVHYVVRPEKPGGSVSYGGMFAFSVTQAGMYRVAIGSGAWIDVLKGKTPVISTAHGHGPACSDIRKMVDFPLKPGRYTLQLAGNGAAQLPLMIARLP